MFKKFNFIDTLYLCTSSSDYSDYINTVSLLMDLVDSEKAIFMSVAGGRTWYQFRDFKIGIMDYEQSKKSNNFQFLVQYRSIYLMRVGYYDPSYNSINVPFGVPNDWQINRIDITEINNKCLLNRIPLSSYRKKTYFKNGMEVETLYLGNRKNGNVFRAYNKSLEMRKKQSFDKMSFLSSIFEESDTLYTYELELGRTFLRERIQKLWFKDLQEILKVWNKIVGSIKWVVDSELNNNLIISKNNKDISFNDIEKLAEYEDFDYKEIKRNKKPSRYFAYNAMERLIISYSANLESMGHEPISVVSFVEEFLEEKQGRIVEYTIEELDNYASFIEVLKNKVVDDSDDLLVSQSLEAFKKANIQGFRGMF